MIGLKKVILTFCICLIGVGGMGNVWASNKTIRDFHEFELWHKLLQYAAFIITIDMPSDSA